MNRLQAESVLECGGKRPLLRRIVESWFGFVAERRPRVAVGLSPRWRTQRVDVAERRLNGWQMRPLERRSATRILASGNRGLKPTATVIQSLRDTGRAGFMWALERRNRASCPTKQPQAIRVRSRAEPAERSDDGALG